MEKIICTKGEKGKALPSLTGVIADNLPKVIETNKTFLEKSGIGIIRDIIVYAVENCRDAVDIIIEKKPDFVLLDYEMPADKNSQKGEYNNGGEVLERLDDESELDTCVKVITSFSRVFDEDLGRFNNYTGSILKTDDPRSFMNHLVGFLKTVVNIGVIKDKVSKDILDEVRKLVDIEYEKIYGSILSKITKISPEKNNREFDDVKIMLAELGILGENVIPAFRNLILKEKSFNKKIILMGVLELLVNRYNSVKKEFEKKSESKYKTKVSLGVLVIKEGKNQFHDINKY